MSRPKITRQSDSATSSAPIAGDGTGSEGPELDSEIKHLKDGDSGSDDEGSDDAGLDDI